ncbi:MAG: hypothetical protein R3B45_06175 [Bdellovibrionota bacterium]
MNKIYKPFIKRILTSTLPVYFLLLAHCGNGSGSSDNEFSQQLIGSWESDCVINKTINQEKEIRTWRFMPSQLFEFVSIQYADNDCTSGNESIVLAGKGSYSLSQPADVGETTRKVGFSYSEFSAIVKDSETASNLSAMEFCNISSWIVDEAVDLYGKECADGEVFPGQNKTIQDLIDVDQNRLWLGEKDNVFDPQTPSAIDAVNVYLRK